MKTKVLTSNANLGLIVGAILLMTGACAKKTESPTAGKSDTSSVAEAPKVDIHTAVVTDNLAAVQQHIKAGSDLNEKDPYGGSSPLMSAAVFGKTAIARELINAGVDLNFKNKEGSTALHTAAFFCRPEIVQMLLNKGADKTIKNAYGATPYQTVPPFQEVKNIYDVMGKTLGPLGLTLDYAYVEKTRPEIAEMLK